MSKETSIERWILLLIPTFIGIVFIIIAISGILSTQNLTDQLVSLFILILGSLTLLYSINEFKIRGEGIEVIKHDERSMINRLKASDLGFRYFFVSLSILVVLNTLSIIDNVAVVAIIGPLIALGVIIQFSTYYWFEKKG